MGLEGRLNRPPVVDPTAGSDRVVLARIGAPHGIRGEVRLTPFTHDPEALAAYGPLESQDGRAITIERVRPAGSVLIAKLQGIDDRTQADALNGTELTIARARLPEPEHADEFYHADLIGLAAIDADGGSVGSVVAVHNFGAGDILEIAPPRGASLLIPFTREAVPAVDLAAGRLLVDPPPETEARSAEDEAGA